MTAKTTKKTADVGGMSAIDRAKKHFSDLGAMRMEVPEWSDDQGRPLVVTASPLTLADKDHLAKVGETYGSQSYETMAHILILHARDVNGRPMFTLEHKQDLMRRVDPDVLSRIAVAIVEGTDPKALKKNSSMTVI